MKRLPCSSFHDIDAVSGNCFILHVIASYFLIMIVEQIGYKKIEDVIKIEHFSIYETTKGTQILIDGTSQNDNALYYPKRDRLPYKIIEGKKICGLKCKIFDSMINNMSDIDTSKWNNGNQIMVYNYNWLYWL